VEGISKKGISGGHNGNAFFEGLNDVGGRIVSETPHPSIQGVKDVIYEVPKKGIDGKPLVPPEYRYIDRPKTIYDPNLISDKQIYEWGLEAMKNSEIVGYKVYGTSSNGLKFEGFYREGKITNFFPVLK
jgi:hypothetical protein